MVSAGLFPQAHAPCPHACLEHHLRKCSGWLSLSLPYSTILLKKNIPLVHPSIENKAKRKARELFFIQENGLKI